MSMRNAIVMFANTLLAVVAALLLYHHFVDRAGREQLLARMHEDNEATKRELDRVVKEQAGIRDALTKSPDMASAADEKSLLIRSDFSAASGSMKTAIAEYYMNSAKLPASNAAAGLPAADQYRGKSLKSATVTADGSIEFVFDADSGVDGGRIRLIPDISRAEAMGVQWRCESADYPLLKRALPACEYRPAGQISQAVTAPESGK
jgi:pilin